LYLFTWKVAAALGTGNTVAAKRSELTPTTAPVGEGTLRACRGQQQQKLLLSQF
jgi:acyl-CoA reductase-like NAD-dependent aldehyde dehydrogenase